MRTVLELSSAHAPEEIQILGHRAIPVRGRSSRFGHGAPVLSNFFLTRAVHIGEARLDQLDRVFVETFEVIRGEIEVLAPVEAKPPHVLLDRTNVAFVFRLRIRVVESKVGDTIVLGGGAEVETDGLRVADVQETVGFGGESRDNGTPVLS